MNVRTSSLMPLTAALVLACGASGSGDESGAGERHGTWKRVRVGVHDAASGRVSIWDLADDAVVGAVDIGPGATLVPSQSGTYAAVVVRGEPVRFLYAGVSVIPHDDHLDLLKAAPSLVSLEIATRDAVSVSAQSGWFGVATRPSVLVKERTLRISEPTVTRLDDAEDAVRELVPFGDDGAVALIGDGSESELVQFDPAGRRSVALARCASGSLLRAVARRALFSCSDGSFIVVRRVDEFVAIPVSTPQRAIEGDIHHGSPVAWVRSGPREAHRVDLDTGVVHPFSLTTDACESKFDPLDASKVVVLGADGFVRVLGQGAEELDRYAVAEPFSCEAEIRPRMVLAPEHAFVARPEGTVVDVDLVRKRVREIPIGHRSDGVLIFGVDPENIDVSIGTH